MLAEVIYKESDNLWLLSCETSSVRIFNSTQNLLSSLGRPCKPQVYFLSMTWAASLTLATPNVVPRLF